jgi:DNA-binding IclR family transcriptional regulator
MLRAGSRAPLHVFSGGKVLLANMSDEAIELYMSRAQFERFTPHTITTEKALWKEIREIRSTGVGYSRDEHTLGVTGVSMALRTSTQVIGTIGVAVATVRFTRQTDTAICRQLTSATARFSAATKTAASETDAPMRRAK